MFKMVVKAELRKAHFKLQIHKSRVFFDASISAKCLFRPVLDNKHADVQMSGKTLSPPNRKPISFPPPPRMHNSQAFIFTTV